MQADRRVAWQVLAIVVVLAAASTVLSGQSSQPPTPSETADAFGEAVRKGDLAVVRKLLDQGVDVNTKFRYGVTALSYACDRGHVDVVKLLLERGADVNTRDTFYRSTPLNWAANPAMGRKPQHAEIVGLLLKRGATGKPQALMAATSQGDAPMVRVILDDGPMPAEMLSNALEAATKTGRSEIVTLLEAAGAKPHVEFKLDPGDLARYSGIYNSPNAVEVTMTAADGRLVGTLAGLRFTLLGRDRTSFRVSEIPGAIITFQVEGDVVKSFTMAQGPGNVVYTRAEGR